MHSDPAPLATILVVDDRVENLRLLASLLGGHGYEVRPVTNGRQAIQAVERDPPDLILLDINMPAMNGYDVCAHIKTLDVARDVPIIFLTALTDTADKVKAFEAGGVDYITKPFQIDEVLARVKTHVTLRRALRDLVEEHERLQVVEDLREKLFNMVVHDMRSPLMALTRNLEFLQEGISGSVSAQASDDLRTSIRAAKTLGNMANELLDVSRLEQGEMPLNRAPTDLVHVTRDVIARLSGMDRTRVFDLDADGDVVVECDTDLVRRVIENLLSNAIKHTPAGSRVRFTVVGTQDRARVALHDQGRGIPVEARKRIFEKFGTIEARERRTHHSAGLGLAFCKLAIDAHGGTISIDSGDPIGSVFWFELPNGK
ncbi:MAG: hybrid sensor histidine kinase/response regulator [Gemmatimonadota bacterium]